MLAFILLTYGPKPIDGKVFDHPAAKQQVANFRALARRFEAEDSKQLQLAYCFDYARQIRDLESLPALKRALERAKELGTTICIDDFRRLFARSINENTGEFLKDLLEYQDHLTDLRTRRRLGDLKHNELLIIAKSEPPVRFTYGKIKTNNTPTDKGREQTRKANLASKTARQNKADEKARALDELRLRLTGEGKAPTLREISDTANCEGLQTSRGNSWSLASVSRALRRLHF